MGSGLATRFTDHLQFVTASNYNATADLHTSQITTTHAFTSCLPVMDLNNGDSSASVLMSLLSSKYPTTALLFQLATSQAGAHLTS
jgi:hypothetical protein